MRRAERRETSIDLPTSQQENKVDPLLMSLLSPLEPYLGMFFEARSAYEDRRIHTLQGPSVAKAGGSRASFPHIL